MPSPLNPYLRLVKRVKWPELAPYVNSVRVSFDPADVGATGVRELFREARGGKIRKLYPSYTAEISLTADNSAPWVEVEYANGEKNSFNASGLKLDEITSRLYEDVVEIKAEDDAKGESREVQPER